ncbi:GTPase [Tolypothrix sp. VBCCA 56010]|uniref:GTPase n=1 Tax=Tolypothrix sp. VBCCA 56010 TaxID=3137731 RepID=UPI003D7DFA6A
MRSENQEDPWAIPPDLTLDNKELNEVDNLVNNEALGFDAPVNILLAGNSGDGKSTLANAMLGVELAATGTGFPVTKGIQCYEYRDKPLTLFDTEGFEILDAERTVSAVKELIESRRKQKDSKQHIHIVWLCIAATSRRLQQVHIDLVRLCSKLQVPVIVVITKSYLKDDSSEAFLKVIGGSLPEADSIIPVLAKEIYFGKLRVAPFGLVQLLDATLSLIPTACQAALKFSQVADFNRKLEAATKVVNVTALGAVGLSFPAAFVPGGHAALLVPLEINMIHQINRALGINLEKQGQIAVAKGTLGIVMATVGGKLIFTETMKFIPFVGQITSTLVGGTIAGTVVKIFGTAYIAAVGDMVRAGTSPTAGSIIDAISSALSTHQHQIVSGATALMEEVIMKQKP